jgi:hypothetical protein
MAEPKLELVKIEAATTEQVSGAARRYVHDAYAAKHFRDTARKLSLRLRKMVESDEQWDALRPREKVALADLILNRAYGRVETISQEDKSAPQESVGALPEHLRSLAGLLALPELKNSAKAEK